MSLKKILVLSCLLVAGIFVLAACAGAPGPAGPAGPAGPVGPAGPAGAAATVNAKDLTCTQCHNNTTLLDGKIFAWEESKHGPAGTAWEEEAGNQSCAGCHEGSSFIDRIAAGQSFADYASAKDITLPDAMPQTCRTCHNIHTTYTKDDLSLRTTAAVAMVTSGQTFDKGLGNLCVNCHQARRYMNSFASKDASGTVIAGKFDISTRFNPHLSNQSDMMLGVGGGGTVKGSPSVHYTTTTDSCVTCHLGANSDHSFDAKDSNCVTCHTDAATDSLGFVDVKFDANGVGARAKIQGKFDSLKKALTAANLIDADGADVPAKGVDEANAFPIWVYGYIMEDGSMGAHNPQYANDLLDAALAAMGVK